MIAAIFAVAFAFQGQLADAKFPICGSERRVTCVVDGDTFWLDRVKYRLAEIDAPEVSNPRCKAEARLAGKATTRLAQLLNGGAFRVEKRGKDQYGRTLAVVSRNGRSFGAQLVSEGLARKWGDRQGWCKS